MPKDPPQNIGSGEPEYRVYRGDGGGVGTRSRGARGAGAADSGGGARVGDPGSPPGGPSYRTYRSAPRGLLARLRGESDADLGRRGEQLPPKEPGRRRRFSLGRGRSGGWSVGRVVKYVLLAIVAWLLLSFVLFMISAQERAGGLPAGGQAALTSGGPILTSANNVLIVGLDNRPTTGAGSKEGGLQLYDRSEKYAHTDTLMLWRVGGGASSRLSIPRDTVVNVPGHGDEKINAAWSRGGRR